MTAESSLTLTQWPIRWGRVLFNFYYLLSMAIFDFPKKEIAEHRRILAYVVTYIGTERPEFLISE